MKEQLDISRSDGKSDNIVTPTTSPFEQTYGESIQQALDIAGWKTGVDLAEVYARTESEVADAVAQCSRTRQRIREIVFPLLEKGRSVLPCAGVYQLTVDNIAKIHENALFNGGVEASDGTKRVFESLPLTITQIGVAIVGYNGNQGTYSHRMYRRDLRAKGLDPAEEAVALLERRQVRGRDYNRDDSETDSELFRRGLMAYAERLLLLMRSSAPWRMGHGNPVPYELITGAGNVGLLLRPGIEAMRALLLDHKRVVYVTSEPSDYVLRTVADALNPLEFAVVEDMTQILFRITGDEGDERRAHYSKEDAIVARQFAAEAGASLVVGVYRASRSAPGQVFYAHKDHAYEAAAIAIADSVLQDHRGFPMLIDLADMICSATFDGATFASSIETAFARVGEPTRYLSERMTRGR